MGVLVLRFSFKFIVDVRGVGSGIQAMLFVRSCGKGLRGVIDV